MISGKEISKFRFILSTSANTYRKTILRGKRPKKGSSKISMFTIKKKMKSSVVIDLYRPGTINSFSLPETR
jgi:hypothetical protein